ncbi:MAG: adenylyltransferase/cytidyltransferase family protein [Elusimicrobiota bacterium]
MATSAIVLDSKRKLAVVVARLRRQGKKIVFTNGCYDILHPGHVALLKKARALGDVLILGLNSDASVRGLKGPSRPILKLRERLAVLSAVRFIDFLVPFGEATPARLISLIRPDVLVKGADWSAGTIVGSDVAKKTVRFPLVKGLSTTALIERIRHGA